MGPDGSECSKEPQPSAAESKTTQPAAGKSGQAKRGRKRKRGSSHHRNGLDANGSIEENVFEVENIVRHEIERDKIYFNVKWKDWPDSTNTWESFDNLRENCLETIVLYFERALGEKTEWLSQSQVFKRSLYRFTDNEIALTANKYIRPSGDTFPEIKPDELEQRINLISRLPLIARDPKLIKDLRNDCLVFEVMKQRQFQLENLAQWEKEINSISTEKVPIKVVNEVDLDMRPMDFKYINRNIQNIPEIISDDPPIGCECTTACTKNKCFCGQQSVFSYNKGLLNVRKGVPIYECNSKCLCGPDCSNRVLQHGRTVKLAIFKTNNGCGWGVRTLENIAKGQFVTEYVGEVITREEADKRGKVYDREGRTYLFDLDFNDADNFPFTVDAAEYGNVSHFINHSCNPNLEVYAVWVGCLDPNMPRLGLYAVKNISAFDELTFDYLCKPLDKTDKRAPQSTVNENKTLCKCNSSNCRKFLF